MGTPGVQAPARLGRYELLARLASGGMGEIFLARLEGAAGFEKLFVVKRILPHLADDVRFRGMLIAEARIASKMSHANICQVYELGETDGQLYIVMEYLEGVALLALLRKASKETKGTGALDLGLVGGVVQQCTDALHYAHELADRSGESFGIVHRDVTPGNIFLTDSGMAKVLDFGIAKVKDASANTQTGTVKGKYAYMAPEQLRGTWVDRRADVFAFGVVLYEMLALRRLFQRKTDYLTFRAVMEQPIPDVRRYRPDVPAALADVLVRALDHEPDNRYATARLLGAAILDAIGTRPWTQADIGDFVRTNFSDEISQARAQTASAIHGTNAGASTSRAGMPMIANSDAMPQARDDIDVDGDEDDGFPSVESSPESSIESRAQRPAPDFQGQTPPPFGAESSSGADNLLAIPRVMTPQPQPQPPLTQPQPQQGDVAGKRSLVWPIFAIAMVGITGAALFLVWRQMENQQPKQEIIITSESTRDAAVAADPVPPPPVPARGSNTGAVVHPPAPPRRPLNPYTAAIKEHKDRINKCATEHGLTGNAKVLIVVTPAGRTKTISFEPESLNGTAIGECIRGVLSGVSFPTSRDEMRVAVPVSMKPG